MDLTDLLKEKFLIWVSKNKATFLLVVLLLGNVYQYMDRKSLETTDNEERRKLNDQIQQITKESVEYERVRSEKLEFLLSNLAKYQDNGDQQKRTKDNR
jgi:hypothetical protein